MGGRLIGQLMRLANRGPIAAAIEALDLQRGDTALDLGCGPGSGVADLTRRCARVYGIDRSAAMVAAARKRNRRAIGRGTARIEQADFAFLPLPDQSVDKVLAANVAYFWTDPATVINELRRVLRPGGQVAIYVTERQAMAKWKFASAVTHRHYDAAGLQAMLTTAGVDCAGIVVRPLQCAGISGLVATIRI
jgi:ubiquinone/menaquinone biosynthesis C-methylase UbiE